MAPMNTFSANGDISSLIFVTQKPINALSIPQAYLLQQNLSYQVIGI